MVGADDLRTPFGAFLRDVGDELAGARHSITAPPPPGRELWRRLSRPTVPIAGESLRGLVARACEANYLPNSWGILQHLGQLNRNRVLVSEDANVDPAELAFAIRVDEHEVRSRRYADLGDQHLSFYGLDLHSDAIVTRTRRFSPAFLNGNRHHLAVWELDDVPFCLRSWDMLQDVCWCEKEGTAQGWVRTGTAVDLCDRCGDPLRWIEPLPVPADMKEALSILEPLVDPSPERRAATHDRLPAGLRGRDRSTVFHLLTRMARAFDPDAAKTSSEAPAERLNGLHRACLALSQWPKGLSEQRWHDRTTDGALAVIHSLWGRLEHSFAAPRSVAAAQGTISADYEQRRIVRDYVGVRRAIELTQLSRATLLAIWDSGLVPKYHRTHGSRTLPAFDADEIMVIAERWRARMDLESVANRCGIPAYGVEQLAALGVIEADGLALPGSGLFFTSHCDTRLVALLDDAAARWRARGFDVEDPLPLRQVLLRIGGRPKPWGPILQVLLLDPCSSDALPFLFGKDGSLGDRILVGRDAVDRITSTTFDPTDHPEIKFSHRIVQRDALEMLNTNPTGVNLLNGLAVQGTNPMTYALRDVEERAAKMVTLREIAARCGLSNRDADIMMAPYPTITALSGTRAWHRRILSII